MAAQSLLDQFRSETERLTGAAPSSDASLGLAVSGGPDSLALLALAAKTYPGAVKAATVDHGLRPEAADEARHVADICKAMSVPHAILLPDRPITGNIQSAAREARYALLEKWCDHEGLCWLATAHHADDQFETILMRLMRGSGITGLSAIRPINGRIVRPLLDIRKADLVSHVESLGLDAIADPSNEDAAFDRVRLRSALKAMPDFDPALIGRSAHAVRQADEALQWVCLREAENHVEQRGEAVFLTRTDYPQELLRRLVIACLERLDPDHVARGRALDRLIGGLTDGKTGTLGKILYSAESSEIWRFSFAPPRKTG